MARPRTNQVATLEYKSTYVRRDGFEIVNMTKSEKARKILENLFTT